MWRRAVNEHGRRKRQLAARGSATSQQASRQAVVQQSVSVSPLTVETNETFGVEWKPNVNEKAKFNWRI